MTGIERLRELGGAVSRGVRLYDVTSRDYDEREGLSVEHDGGLLGEIVGDIAGQIAREHAEDCFRMGERAADVSVSACDLLPEDEREAIAWVREHGGIAYVKDAWRVRSNLARQLETAQAKVERQQRHIEFVQGKCRERQEHIVKLNKTVQFLKFNNSNFRALQADVAERLGFTRYGDDYEPEDLLDALDRRLMPEGMEWLVEAWPRFEDDAPVRFGEEAMGFSHKPPFAVDHVTLFDGGEATVCAEADLDSGKVDNFVRILPGERVKRPAPKVLDADGVEIRVGDTVFLLPGEWCNKWPLMDCPPDCEMKVMETHDVDHDVAGVIRCRNMNPGDVIEICFPKPSQLTHRAPVLAADGRPLREGETVWSTDSGTRYTVEKVTDELIPIKCCSEMGSTVSLHPSQLTHERPDSWERLEEDADRGPQGDMDFEEFARDLVRRARALAERGR